MYTINKLNIHYLIKCSYLINKIVLLINSDINRYISVKSIKHNICYFKHVSIYKLKQKTLLSFNHVTFKATSSAWHVAS